MSSDFSQELNYSFKNINLDSLSDEDKEKVLMMNNIENNVYSVLSDIVKDKKDKFSSHIYRKRKNNEIDFPIHIGIEDGNDHQYHIYIIDPPYEYKINEPYYAIVHIADHEHENRSTIYHYRDKKEMVILKNIWDKGYEINQINSILYKFLSEILSNN